MSSQPYLPLILSMWRTLRHLRPLGTGEEWSSAATMRMTRAAMNAQRFHEIFHFFDDLLRLRSVRISLLLRERDRQQRSIGHGGPGAF